MSEEDEDFDIIVIGAGPAGLTAGIYSSWLGLRTLVRKSVLLVGELCKLRG